MSKIAHKQIGQNDKKRLTPLSFWANFFENLLLILPRCGRDVNLEPFSEIVEFDFEHTNFLSEDEPPIFKLTFQDKGKPYGWFYLEAVLVRHTGNRLAKLLINLENNSKLFINVPSNLRGTIREVIYIPKNSTGIFWQPSTSTGWFSQRIFTLYEISSLESFYRRLWRVLGDYWPRRHLLMKDSILHLNLFNILFNLKTAYEWSANLRINKQPKVSYDLFIKSCDTLNSKDIQLIDNNIQALNYKPLFSIIMPVYNPPVKFFKEALDSVIAQRYSHWELCIADDASTNPEIKAIINDYQLKDFRIKAVFRTENGHISDASNSALEIASGDYLVLMDHDDLIPVQALYHVALEINQHPDAALIYSDEDKVNEFGVRYEPYFKSDWNEDLFYSQNFINHLGVYKTDLVKELSGFRKGYEGAQHYDLALRLISKIKPNRIRHIRRVLYHWRAYSASTAQNADIHSYAHQAGINALNDYFLNTGAFAQSIIDNAAGLYRIIRPAPTIPPLVSLIIATRDKVGLLEKCITSIQSKTNYTNYEIIIIDNQSTEKETLSYLDSLKDIANVRVLHYDQPFNYSAINNFAVNKSYGDIIGLINNDIEVISEDWLMEMVINVIRPEVGVVGAKLLYPDNTIQHAGVILGIGGMACHAHKYLSANDYGYFGRAIVQQEMSAVTAACMLVRKEVYFKAGMLDEENLTVAFNDVDFCLKVKALGLKVIYTPFSILYHHESISRGQEDTAEKQKRQSAEMAFMRNKWGNLLDSDPYYNPNLSTFSGDFSLSINQFN